MGLRPRKNALYIAIESTFSTDPSANGAGYLHVPAASVGEIQDQKEIIETEWHTGRNRATPALSGRDGWSIDVEGPVIGLPAAAGDTATPALGDWFDVLLEHVIGQATTTDGTAVTSATTTTLTPGADELNAEDLLCVHEAGAFTHNRAQWRRVLSEAAGVYTVTLPFDSTPTSSAVAYGVGNYVPTSDEGGASTIALVADMGGTVYTLLGGRVTSFTITGEINGYVRFSASITGDRYSEDTSAKTSLPTTAATCSPTPVRALLSPLYFADASLHSPINTTIPTKRFELNFGIEASEVESTEAAHGRANIESTKLRPTLAVEPLFSDDLLQLKRATEDRVAQLLLHMGSGDVSGGVLNSCAFFAEAAQVSEGNPTADGDRRRFPLTFRIVDAGELTPGGSIARLFTFARA